MSVAASAYQWRAAALVGLVAGLGLAESIGGEAPIGLGDAVALSATVALARPTLGRAGWGPWIALVGMVAALTGLAIADSRLEAIDSGRLAAKPGAYIELRGTAVSAPRASADLTRFVLEADAGRIAVEMPTQEVLSPNGGKTAQSAGLPTLGAIDEGSVVLVEGTVREPAPWELSQIERAGASRVLAAESVEATGFAREGLRGALDDVRRRAEDALEQGTEAPAAALLRGFVLGQDDLIAEDVREDFRRSGLAHVLAVSGQNVMLLAILATPLLALAGVPLRARLVAVGIIIAIYVPVAGAGASIQRAGLMGLAGLVAALASRPSARWYALGLAAAVTLAIDPRATADIGWQLSFAAVAGLLVLAPALIRVLGGGRTGVRRGFAEGAAITLAATLATAPLAAHHFGTVSLTAIPANLLALPAIAPAMWLGMLSGALGQIPSAPVEPLTWLGGLCAGFIGWVAHALGPDWAQLDLPEPGAPVALVWTFVLVGGSRLVCFALERRDGLRAAPRPPRRLFTVAALGAAALVVALAISVGGDERSSSTPLLAIRLLDVGQGDAILIEPRGHPPLLVDTGPPGGDVGEQLADHGINELFAIVITHDDLDHSGGLADALKVVDAERLLIGKAVPQSCRYLACPPATTLDAGSVFRIGPARIEVVWPPPDARTAENPNDTGLVLSVSAGEFDALLTGDAEAEVASYGSGPVDLLKVAHHGSEDVGLDGLLARTTPQLAVISVGDDNPYGHPAPETVDALAEHGVPAMRTDQSGEIVVSVERAGWSVGTSE